MSNVEMGMSEIKIAVSNFKIRRSEIKIAVSEVRKGMLNIQNSGRKPGNGTPGGREGRPERLTQSMGFPWYKSST